VHTTASVGASRCHRRRKSAQIPRCPDCARSLCALCLSSSWWPAETCCHDHRDPHVGATAAANGHRPHPRRPAALVPVGSNQNQFRRGRAAPDSHHSTTGRLVKNPSAAFRQGSRKAFRQ
jgi:hypothetical protein